MKKICTLLITVMISAVLCCFPAFGKDNDEWKEKPVITNVYELTKEKMLIEWDGHASLYQVYVDGKQVASVNLPTTVIDIKGGMHQITVMPVSVRSKEGDKNFSFNLSASGLADILKLLNVPVVKDLGNINVGLDMDLSAFGIDPKDLIMGNPSETVKINYTPNAVSAAAPEILVPIRILMSVSYFPLLTNMSQIFTGSVLKTEKTRLTLNLMSALMKRLP